MGASVPKIGPGDANDLDDSYRLSGSAGASVDRAISITTRDARLGCDFPMRNKCKHEERKSKKSNLEVSAIGPTSIGMGFSCVAATGLAL